MSFFFMLVYLFCTFIRPQDWVAGVYGVSLINYVSLITIFFLLIEKMGRKGIELVNVPQNQLMLGLYISILMSHIVHTYFWGLNLAFQEFLINFILFFIIQNAISSEKKYKISLWFIILLIIVLVPQGIYQLKHGYGWAMQEITFDHHRVEYRINWIGIFNDPNDLAIIFVMACGFLLSYIFGKTNFLVRILSSGLLGTAFYGIYLTNSRGGLVALMATIYFYFVRRTKKIVMGSVLGGLLASAVILVGPSRMGIISTSEGSANARIDLWYGGIMLLKANPLFGAGYDMFMEELPQTAHNSYVLAAAELGMFGLFFWMALIYVSFKELNLVQKHCPRLVNLALGVQSSLLGFCVAAFFLSRTYTIIPYMLFALSGALFHVGKGQCPELDLKLNGKDYKRIFGLSVAILVLVYIFIKVGL